MVDVDIDAFLQQGYWPNSRARSPDSRFFTSSAPSGQSSHVNVATPRRFQYNVGRPRDYPPPPSVEDETESLAKEYGAAVPQVPGEEPVNRGDLEQYPILLPIHEYNPERRFVIIPSQSDTADDSARNTKKLPRRPKPRDPEPEPEATYYKANTGRRYEAHTHNEDESETKRDAQPNREKRRSKLEQLPTISTDIEPEPETRSSDTGRPKSTVRSDRDDDDYIPPRPSHRFQTGNTLSPDVIEHASRGRDRAYYQGGSDSYAQTRDRSAQPNVQYEKSPRDDRRYKDRPLKPAKSTSPTHHNRRPTAEDPRHMRTPSKADYERPIQYTESRPPRPDYNVPARSERDTSSQVSSSSTEKKEAPPYIEHFYSSDEEAPHHTHSRRRRESSVSYNTKSYLQTPVEIRPSDTRRSRGPSPLPPAGTSRIYENDSVPSGPRSATFPKEMKTSRSEHRSQPPLSRTSTGRSEFNPSAPIAIPAGAAAAAAATTGTLHPGSLTGPRKPNILSSPRTGSIQPDPRSSTSALSSSPQRHARRLLESSSPHDDYNTNHAVPPYRRYLDEVQAGELPDMYRCPRRQATAGYVDWLTLPRCDNFNICPSCYETVFSNTEFAHHFVPTPFRSADRPLACDFGTSRFYHIAYYLTRKYGKADLALFRNIANITAQCQPCTGSRETIRIWYSVKDPRSGRPIESFNVCYTCAKTVEVLLPNLTGVFVPMDSPAESTRGVCSMHQENERRFLFYFDLLEAVADKALITRSTPDVQALADRIRDMTEVPECARDTPVRNRRWYTMRSIPDFTVCEECFGEVVWPMIQRDSSSIAANFHKNPQKLPLAACQLYSERMRNIFKWAVRHSDLRYLDNKVRERRVKEQEYHTRIVGLDRQILGPEWVDAEVDQAMREWHRWE